MIKILMSQMNAIPDNPNQPAIDIKTWEIPKQEDFISISIARDRVVLKKEKQNGRDVNNDTRIIPFSIVQRVSATDSSLTLLISYDACDKYETQFIKFHSTQHRDEVFADLSASLASKFECKTRHPKKVERLARAAAFGCLPALVLLLAFTAQGLENGTEDFGGPSKANLEAERNLDTLIKIAVTVFCRIFGSRSLFVISYVGFGVVLAYFFYLMLSLPAQLSIERYLERRKTPVT